MDNKEELKRSLAEEEQRAKDSLANVEKMKKQLEELNKKEEQPTVSATGVILEQVGDKNFFYLISAIGEINIHMITSQNTGKLYIDKGNAFETAEQAEQESLRREGQEFIRRCAMLWNKGNDWRKKDTLYQCHLYFKPSSDSLCYMYDNNIAKGIPYFDNIALAEKCIAELKKKYNDEQIKTIFGVE